MLSVGYGLKSSLRDDCVLKEESSNPHSARAATLVATARYVAQEKTEKQNYPRGQ